MNSSNKFGLLDSTIELGRKYPLILKNYDSCDGVWNLLYLFKPSHLDLAKTGLLKLSADDSSVMIDLANNVSGIDSFSGNVITPLHTNGVLLHFDNDKFIMRRVTKEIQQLKHLRDEATFGGKIVSKRPPKNLSLPTRPPKKKVKLKESVELGKEATVEEPVLPTS